MSIKYKEGDLLGPCKMKLIKRLYSKPGHSYGLIECSECKAPFEADIYHVNNGKIKFCPSCRLIQHSGDKNNNFKDLIGQKFGKLTVISYAGVKVIGQNPPQKRTIWNLKCDCGKEVIKTTNELTTGHTKSCGQCLLKSNGEWKIQQLLIDNNINYEAQKYFPTCYRIKGKLCSFDFFLPGYNTCIEYDGTSHYFPNPRGDWNTAEAVAQQKERDIFKNQWCKNNNIILIRIPYTHYDDISIQDLLPQTSNFII